MTQGTPALLLPVSPDSELMMQWRPLKYQSPVSYRDEDVRSIATEDISEDHETDDDASAEAAPSEATTRPN